MVQCLACVIEDSAVTLLYDRFQISVLEFRSHEQLVEVVNISLVVLAIVQFNGLFADNRLQEFAEPDLDLIKEIMEATEELDAELTGYNLDELIESTVVPDVEFKEYDESVADDVEYIECPECGHRWPK